MMRVCFLPILLLLVTVADTAAPRVADSIADRVDATVRSEIARQRIPGAAVAVILRGSVVIARGYGLANVEHEIPVDQETIFQSGSLGKQFTATAVMLLVEDGKLSLDDPLVKFFPAAPRAWSAITVRHLLTHTSGIANYTNGAVDLRRDYTEEQLAEVAYALKPDFPPGDKWKYSNTGYVLLGVIIHKVSGQFYGDVLQQRVFSPLGMSTARVISEADIVPHRAAGYHLNHGVLKNQEWVAPSLNTTADGALYLSLRDLMAWDAGVRARRVLAPASWAQVLQPVRLNDGTSAPYGFGWSVESRAGKPLYHHGGSWQGFKTHYARFLADDLSVIVLANLAEAQPERIVTAIASAIDPGLAPPARQRHGSTLKR